MKYKNHPSITALKEKSKISKFIFHEVGNEKIINEIKRLNKNKPSQKFDIPITIIDKSTNIFEDFLAEKSSKLADITALHKKGRKVNKENYRPVSILPTMQILKRLQYATLPFEFIRKKKELCWQRIYTYRFLEGILFFLFDYKLLTAQFNVYGLALAELRLIRDYLPNRKQRKKIDDT